MAFIYITSDAFGLLLQNENNFIVGKIPQSCQIPDLFFEMYMPQAKVSKTLFLEKYPKAAKFRISFSRCIRLRTR